MTLHFAAVKSGRRQSGRRPCRETGGRIPARRPATLRAAGIALSIVLAPAVAAAQQPREPFALGRGVPLGSTGVRLGGYVAVEVEKPSNEPATFVFDDLSLFVFGDVGARGRFFVEMEDSKFWRVRDGSSRVEHHPDLERMYADYLHADSLKLRVGKFLTPVGTWNEIHPDPLTWTVSRPIASYGTFPTFLTGAQVFGTIARAAMDVEYTVFAQANPCLDCNTNDRQTERAIGGRLRLRFQDVEIGVPVLRYIDRLTADRVALTGGDLVARRGPLEVRGEATVGGVRRRASRETRLEYAWYLQGLCAVSERYSLVLRGERARAARTSAWTSWSGGVLFRPRPAVSAKLEIQRRRGVFPVDEGEPGTRVLASFGVLF